MPAKKEEFAFEKSLVNLESIVEQMESGEMSLEQSLQAFESGVKLTSECQKALAEAEQKINILLEKNGELTSQKFIASAESGGEPF